MSISIKDIAREISWTIDNKVYLKTDKQEYSLLIEYLNQTNNDILNQNLELLESFKAIIETKNKNKIEEYLIGHYGFNQYNDGNVYAFLAGATDLGLGILYQFETDAIFIKHVYGEPNEKYPVSLDDLIHILKQKKAIANTIAL